MRRGPKRLQHGHDNLVDPGQVGQSVGGRQGGVLQWRTEEMRNKRKV